MYINEKLEMCKKYLNGKSASVIGVGISNIPLINFLLKNNVKVTARDKKSIDEISGNKDFDYENLKKLGVESVYDDFITSSQATAFYLKKYYKDARLYVCGTESLKEELRNNGFCITENTDDA